MAASFNRLPPGRAGAQSTSNAFLLHVSTYFLRRESTLDLHRLVARLFRLPASGGRLQPVLGGLLRLAQFSLQVITLAGGPMSGQTRPPPPAPHPPPYSPRLGGQVNGARGAAFEKDPPTS